MPHTRDVVQPPLADNKAFGSALKKARERAGLEQIPLGETVGVSRKSIGRWEKGDVQPQTRYVATLMQTGPEARDSILASLGVPVPALGPEDTPQVRRFMERMLAGLDHEKWDRVARMIDDALQFIEEPARLPMAAEARPKYGGA